MTFGASVRSKRRGHGLTLEQLSERVGITPNYLGRIENGRVDPSLSVVVAIARALDADIAELVGRDEAAQTKRRVAPRLQRPDVGKAIEGLPLDVREKLVPALWAIVDRLRPPRGRRRRP
jgi:transcriptional regulator with XRE-family HTH domain